MRLALTLAISLVFGSEAFAKDLATINGKTITDAEFKEELKQLGPQAEMLKQQPEARVSFLNQLITIKLLEDAARKGALEKTPDFQKRMASVERQVLAQMYLEKHIADNTQKKDQEKYFNENKKNFSDKEVCASHILVKSDQEALGKEVLAEAKKGGDFDALIKKYEKNPGVQEASDLGCFGKGRMVPEFEKASFETPKNTLHGELVKTQFGFHVIKVKDIKGGDEVKFDQVQTKVERELQKNVRDSLLENIRKEAKVVVNDKEVQSLEL
jgi:peptidyl-prolyl cis-trans isomerase C